MKSRKDALMKRIVDVLRANNIKKAGVFGSYARGEQKDDSDVDILVDFNGSLLDLVALEMLLKKKLRKKVDLLTYGCIHPLLRERILKEEVKII